MKYFIFFVYTVLSISIGFAQDSSIKGVRLGDHINSRYGEVMPVVSVDGKELYVSRFDPYALSKEVDKHFATFWRSIKQADGTWGPMALIQDIPYFNTGRNRVGFAHLPNGSFLVKGEFQDGIYQHDGFSILAKDSLGNWMNPVGLNIPNYTNLHHYSQASAHMSADGKTLVFYARKDSTVSISKLFVTFEKEGKWTEPLDVGPTINVPNSHVLSPFLCADGKTMYFSSNRLGGLGSNDIFMTKRLDDSWTNWSRPVNIGAAINTPNWDTYLTISAVDKRTYYISNPEDRNTSTDIFQIKLPDSLLPEPVILLKGHVYEDESTIPLGSRISVREIETNKEVAYTTSDPKTGRFQLVLPKGKRYTFYAAKDRMFSIRENLDVTAIDSSIIIEKNLYLAIIQPGERIKLNNLFFERGRSNILPISLPELDNLVKILKRKQDLTIRIEGHTDNLGSKSLNLRLSELRAEKVKAYLIKKGIHKKRLKTKGYGGTLPVADNRNPITRKLNRRVEFFILE